ncbi:hypothetical protein DMUE_4818 [Dictyocoela muelleri]|nr:hypothetical protein DMUE_4818 [Dictyocoela muelleri]
MLFIYAYYSFDNFLGRSLKIHLSRFPKKEISYNLLENQFSLKESNENYLTKSIILKNRSLYNIKIGNKKLCVDKDEFSTKGECNWDIVRYPFGYIIHIGIMCLTLDDKLRLSKCNFHEPLVSQLFSFSIVRECLRKTDIFDDNDEENEKEFKEIIKKYKLDKKPNIKKLIKKIHNIRKNRNKVPWGSFKSWKFSFC